MKEINPKDRDRSAMRSARSKVIYYSDKSETDDGMAIMADTPSNYDM